VLPTQVFSQDMAVRKKGVIINIASMAAFRHHPRSGYSAAKAAVANFTEWLAVEMAKKFGEGIRVNAISPGYFLTEQNGRCSPTGWKLYGPRASGYQSDAVWSLWQA